jgi:LCP family protein required for cell wall assembly
MKTFFSRFFVAVVLTAVLSAAGIAVVNEMIDSRFDNLKRKNVNVAADTGSSEPANFLLIGSDTREFVKTDQDKQSFTDSDGEIGQRSDTMMIVNVDPKSKKTTVMSIPRDSIVDIPGIGTQKINASFNKDLGGGPDKVIETIKTNFDIDIQHFVELDFDTFRQIVDALGSVNVYFPAPARDKKSGLNTNMQMGCLPLNGDAALSFVRSRYYEQYIDGQWESDPTSDFGRIARQQEFMKRVASVAARKSLTDPLKGRDISDAIIKNLQVDQELKKDDIFKLMNAFNGIDPNDPEYVTFATLPTKSVFENGVSKQIIQKAEAEPILEIFRDLTNKSEGKDAEIALPKPSAVKLRVLNASGEKGLAASVMSSMQEIGFATAGTGNASSRSVTEIHYSENNKAKAMLVAKYVNGVLVKDSAISDADVVLILGPDFEKVDSAGKIATPKPTETTAPTTTKPATKSTLNGVVETTECPA